ncbi:MAG: DUF4880 domain-containing protein, partial [Pseudohongiellaceae bacterium]
MKIIDFTSLRGQKAEIETQAREWVIRLDDEFTELDRQEFANWLQRSPAHPRLFREVAALWMEMDRLSEISGVNFDREPNHGFFRTRPVSAACTMLVLLALVITAYRVLPDYFGPAVVFSEFSTGIGEIHLATLADGSSISLNTGT